MAVIYAVLVTMSAAAWRAEAKRAVEGGASRSALHDALLQLGFRVVCSEAAAVLAAAEAAGEVVDDDTLLTAVYVGQEARGSLRFCRVWEHGTASGNENVAELWHCSHRQHGSVRTAHEGVHVHRTLLAMLPLSSQAVDIAEAALMAALLK